MSDPVYDVIKDSLMAREEAELGKSRERAVDGMVQGIYVRLTLTRETRYTRVPLARYLYLFSDIQEHKTWTITASRYKPDQHKPWKQDSDVHRDYGDDQIAYNVALMDFDFYAKKYGLTTTEKDEWVTK